GGSWAATRGLSGGREPGPARRRALRHHAPQSPRPAAIKRDACRPISELGEEPQKSAAVAALVLAAAVLLNRDLLRADLDELRQRQLQHAVDMLRLGGVRIDCFRESDRTARLAKAALAPQRLAVGLQLFAVLDGDRDVAVFDLDLDLVLGDAGNLGLHDVRFRGLDDVQIDAAASNARAAVDGREERA